MSCDYCEIVKIVRQCIKLYGIGKIVEKSDKLFQCLFCELVSHPNICKVNLKEFSLVMHYLLKSEYNIHSGFWCYKGPGSKGEYNRPTLKILKSKIMYIKIPKYSIADKYRHHTEHKETMKYIKECDDFFANSIDQNINKLIIDVRGNTGGDSNVMHSMLKTIYGTKPCRARISNGRTTWYSILDKGVDINVNKSKYDSTIISKPDLDICILIDRETMSAGEFCVLPFYNTRNKRIQFIGEPSGGLTTENYYYFINYNDSTGKYSLSKNSHDNSRMVINLTISECLDVNGHQLKDGKLIPDIESQDPLKDAIRILSK